MSRSSDESDGEAFIVEGIEGQSHSTSSQSVPSSPPTESPLILEKRVIAKSHEVGTVTKAGGGGGGGGNRHLHPHSYLPSLHRKSLNPADFVTDRSAKSYSTIFALTDEESKTLIRKFRCVYHKSVLHHGKLYIFAHTICWISNTGRTKVFILCKDVKSVEKKKKGLVTAIYVNTTNNITHHFSHFATNKKKALATLQAVTVSGTQEIRLSYLRSNQFYKDLNIKDVPESDSTGRSHSMNHNNNNNHSFDHCSTHEHNPLSVNHGSLNVPGSTGKESSLQIRHSGHSPNSIPPVIIIPSSPIHLGPNVPPLSLSPRGGGRRRRRRRCK